MIQIMTAEQQVSKAKIYLMNNKEWRWMAGILMMGNIKFVSGPDEEVQTAATNGIDEVYNRDFLTGKSMEEVRFVVLHESMHKLFRHLFLWQGLWKQNPMLANIACDVVINTQYLKDKAGVTFVAGGVDMPEYKDKYKWSAKAIFDDLMKKSKGGGAGDGKGGHDMHQWGEAGQISAKEAAEIGKQIDIILRQASQAGEGNNGMPLDIQAALVPEVDWRSYMAEFVKKQCAGKDKHTWRRPHRTYIAHDLYMPSDYSETVGKILIAGDTSGSISNDVLGVFLGYMQQLCDEVNPDGVDIAWWGSSVVGVDTFAKGSIHLEGSIKPVGGGGTSPGCITDWMREEKKTDYVCAVVLTDGEFFGDGVGDWGGLPVLWVVVNECKVPEIPVGVTIHVEDMR